jgi:hypothetical protein
MIREYFKEVLASFVEYLTNKIEVGWPRIYHQAKCYTFYIDHIEYTYLIDYQTNKTTLSKHRTLGSCNHKTLNCVLEINPKDVRQTIKRFNQLMLLK